MSLAVRQIELRDFRSYGQCRISGMGQRMVLVGPNASGKTNIVEALQLCTGMSSFRNPRPLQLVRMGSEFARVCVESSDGLRELQLKLDVDDKGRRYELNGKRRTGASLKGIMPAVVFTPDDLSLAKGSSSVRRHQLDSLGSQVSVGYRSVLQDYAKLIRQKNRCLKEGASSSYLAAFDDLLCRVGSQLFVLRMKLIAELEPYMVNSYALISGGTGDLRLSYVPSWVQEIPSESSLPEGCDFLSGEACDKASVSAKLARALEIRREEERVRGRSLVGPHADKVGFVVDGNDASLFASQGQQRSAVLSLKMAELSLVMSRIEQSPLLLLDDVMSELDENRRKAFIEAVPPDVQMVVTTTNRGYFDRTFLSTADVVDMDECLVRGCSDGFVCNRMEWSGFGKGGVLREE